MKKSWCFLKSYKLKKKVQLGLGSKIEVPSSARLSSESLCSNSSSYLVVHSMYVTAAADCTKVGLQFIKITIPTTTE